MKAYIVETNTIGSHFNSNNDLYTALDSMLDPTNEHTFAANMFPSDQLRPEIDYRTAKLYTDYDAAVAAFRELSTRTYIEEARPRGIDLEARAAFLLYGSVEPDEDGEIDIYEFNWNGDSDFRVAPLDEITLQCILGGDIQDAESEFMDRIEEDGLTQDGVIVWNERCFRYTLDVINHGQPYMLVYHPLTNSVENVRRGAMGRR